MERPGALIQSGELLVIGVVPGLLVLQGGDRVLEVGPALVRGEPLHAQPADRLGESGGGAGEHEPADALGIAARPGDRDEAAVRMAEQVEAVDIEVRAHRLDIGRVVLEVVARRIRRPAGIPCAARVEHHERSLGRQLRQLSEVKRGAAGPAGMEEQGRAGAHLTPREGPRVVGPQARHWLDQVGVMTTTGIGRAVFFW